MHSLGAGVSQCYYSWEGQTSARQTALPTPEERAEHASPGSLQPAAEGGEWKEPDDPSPFTGGGRP